MIGHTVCRTCFGNRRYADNAVADFALAVPVCILDKIEQPDRAPRRIIVLLPLAALVPGICAGRGACDARQRICARLGVVVGNRVVAANIAARAGMLGKASERSIGNVIIDLALAAVIDDLIVKLRDKDHRIVGRAGESGLSLFVRHSAVDDVVFFHALPRHEIIKRRAASACADGRARLRRHGGVDVAVRVVARRQTGERRRGIAVRPADTEDRHEHARYRAGLVRGRVVVCVAGNGNCNRNRTGVFVHARHSHDVSGKRGCGNLRMVRRNRDRTCAEPRHGERIRQLSILQRDRSLAERQRAIRFADLPRDSFRRRRAVCPLVERRIFQREFCTVCAGVRAAGRAAERHLCCIVVVPRRALRAARIRQAAALAWHGHIRLGDGDGLRCGAGNAALRVANRDTGAACFQTAARLDRNACCNQRGVVGIRRLDNHASRRKLLTSLVGGLCRRRCDLNGRELDAATASADHLKYFAHCATSALKMFTEIALVGVSVQVNGIFPFSVMSPTFTPASPHAVRLVETGVTM